MFHFFTGTQNDQFFYPIFWCVFLSFKKGAHFFCQTNLLKMTNFFCVFFKGADFFCQKISIPNFIKRKKFLLWESPPMAMGRARLPLGVRYSHTISTLYRIVKSRNIYRIVKNIKPKKHDTQEIILLVKPYLVRIPPI